jgi:hypothetical protein
MAGVRVVVQEILVATETEREGGKGEATAVLPGAQEVEQRRATAASSRKLSSRINSPVSPSPTDVSSGLISPWPPCPIPCLISFLSEPFSSSMLASDGAWDERWDGGGPSQAGTIQIIFDIHRLLR